MMVFNVLQMNINGCQLSLWVGDILPTIFLLCRFCCTLFCERVLSEYL